MSATQSMRPPATRLRVLVISHAYNGPGRMGPFSELAKHVDLILVGPQEHPNGVLAGASLKYEDGSLSVIPLRTVQLGRSQFLMRNLLRTVRGCRPDVVCVEYDPWHVQFLQVVSTLTLTRSSARIVPVVKKNTYRAPTSVLGRVKRAVSQWGVRRSSAIIAASNMTREVYIRELGAPASSVVVQPHLAVDVERFQPRVSAAGQGTVRIGFVGKIGTTKGVPELLTAFERVRQHSEIAVELWLAGGVVDSTTEYAIAAAQNVRHVGLIDNNELHNFLADLDVFVMPARVLPDHQEHDGRAVLEAMAAGIPCVVSDSGILPEIVSSAEGRVFPAGSTSQLAHCLAELVGSPELRRELGVHARQRALSTVSPDILSAERVAIFNKTMEVQ